MTRKLFLFCLLLVLAACQAATPPAPTSSPTPLPPTPTPFPDPFEGKAKIGNYNMQITCWGTGEPTIILENELNSEVWLTTHLQTFSSITRTCRYPRVGMTAETENVTGPRTALDQVKELHALLQQTGVPGPYILVGFNMSTQNIVLYTNMYPDEVVGLVCLDCGHPSFLDFFAEKTKLLLTAEPNLSEDDKQTIDYFLSQKNDEEFLNIKEHIDIPASEKQVLAVTSLGDRPLIVLMDENITQETDNKLTNAYMAAAYESATVLSKLSTQGRIEVVKGTSYETIASNVAVPNAIKEVYAKVKK